MHLAGLSAGSQAPRGRFNGAVHSVFRQACNIRLDDRRLLALLAPQLGNVPHGVRLDVPAGFVFAHHLRVGQPVGCRADVLRVARGELSIDLGTAAPWRGELPAAGIDLMSPKVAGAWRTAWHVWQRNRPRVDPCDVVSRPVVHQGVRLARAAQVLAAEEATSALGGLIGRGPGLTPSGDDLTVGFLAGLWSPAADHSGRRGFLRALCAAIAAAAATTGDLSRAYLEHATHGRFAEPLTMLVRQIGEGADARVVEVATLAALRVGHTSGAEGVFGLLLGLVVWAPQSVLPGLARLSDIVARDDRRLSGSAEPVEDQARAVAAPIKPAAVGLRGGVVTRRASVQAACGDAAGRRDLSRALSLGVVNSFFGWSMRPWPSVPAKSVRRRHRFPGSHGPANPGRLGVNG